jgi:hypothetical protein
MENHYTAQSSRLLTYFNWVMKRLRSSFADEFGDALANEIIEKSSFEFEKILPELPYIGGRENLFTPILIASGGMLAISRVMKTYSKTAEEMFIVFYTAIDKIYNLLPRILMQLFGRLFLSRYGGIGLLRRQANKSQELRYPDDWVFTVVEGDGEDFDWILEYSECAVVKFWEKQGANDLMPYCSFGDIAMSRALGLGMECATLGEGSDTCVAKLKRGRETQMRDWIPV